jgi:hypothetical protein
MVAGRRCAKGGFPPDGSWADRDIMPALLLMRRGLEGFYFRCTGCGFA